MVCPFFLRVIRNSHTRRVESRSSGARMLRYTRCFTWLLPVRDTIIGIEGLVKDHAYFPDNHRLEEILATCENASYAPCKFDVKFNLASKCSWKTSSTIIQNLFLPT